MRKLIVANMMSLDGYYEGPGKDVMALFSYRQKTYPTDQSFDEYNAERLRSADTLVLGRVTYKSFKDYWPLIADDPKAEPIEREISRLNNAIEKIVVSDSLVAEGVEAWQNSRVIRRSQAHRELAKLKRTRGNDILVFGSHVLWNDLLRHHLVDELHLMTGPVVLGGGTPIFNSTPSATLRLIDAFTWRDSGNVLTRYKVAGK